MGGVATMGLDQGAAAERLVRAYDWSAAGAELSANGCTVLERLLAPEACAPLAALYACDEHFRSHVHMARHGFGKGEYKYFRIRCRR